MLGFLGRQDDFILVIENYICLCAYAKKPTKKMYWNYNITMRTKRGKIKKTGAKYAENS